MSGISSTQSANNIEMNNEWQQAGGLLAGVMQRLQVVPSKKPVLTAITGGVSKDQAGSQRSATVRQYPEGQTLDLFAPREAA